ncbi:MAG: biotin transporter BioY [Deltaproteobacteria bacterium]|nr:biotin transporter BioY [Deltaproteobacteria bacterium]
MGPLPAGRPLQRKLVRAAASPSRPKTRPGRPGQPSGRPGQPSGRPSRRRGPDLVSPGPRARDPADVFRAAARLHGGPPRLEGGLPLRGAGLAGFPAFSGGAAGPALLFGPAAGFARSFPPAAAVAGPGARAGGGFTRLAACGAPAAALVNLAGAVRLHVNLWLSRERSLSRGVALRSGQPREDRRGGPLRLRPGRAPVQAREGFPAAGLPGSGRGLAGTPPALRKTGAAPAEASQASGPESPACPDDPEGPAGSGGRGSAPAADGGAGPGPAAERPGTVFPPPPPGTVFPAAFPKKGGALRRPARSRGPGGSSQY